MICYGHCQLFSELAFQLQDYLELVDSVEQGHALRVAETLSKRKIYEKNIVSYVCFRVNELW